MSPLPAQIVLASILVSLVRLQALANPGSSYAPNRVLLKLRDDVGNKLAVPSAEDWANRLGLPQGANLHRLDSWKNNSLSPGQSMGVDRPLVLELNGKLTVPQAIALLHRHSDVLFAEPDYIGHGVAVPNDPYFSWQWHHQTIQSETAWDITTGRSSVVVAVLDSGINQSLSEFSNRLLPGHDYAYNDSDPADDFGHGTAVSGTIAANANNGILVAGINWYCKILPEKVLRSDNFGYYSWWAAAIYDVTDAGAKVINLSASGSESSDTLQAAIDYAISHGVIFVTASGNDSGSVAFPGRLPECITVGATERDDVRASFSNSGAGLDLVAPGRDIYTVGKNGGLEYWYGTSFSTAEVTGVASLVVSRDPWINQSQMAKLLEASADDRVGDATDAPGWDQYYGYGRLNARKAVQLAQTNITTEATLVNISTRLDVGTSENVLIAGVIIGGNESKKIMIRGLGPSLTQFGISNAMGNPELELRGARGSVLATNDDWQTTQTGGLIAADQAGEIQSSGKAPPSPAEAAIIVTLPTGNYTAILRGVSSTTGVGLVEVYDLNPDGTSRLNNISTRGLVQSGEGVMIGGLIVVTKPTRVMVRALGPSLSELGIANPLSNPQLELHDSFSTIATNDDWQSTQIGGIIDGSQVSAIQVSGYTPPNINESAIITTLEPGNYTAVVRGSNNTTGVALVEVYNLNSN